MNINKYINWNEIWDEEICPMSSIDCLGYGDDYEKKESIKVIKQFMEDKNVKLISDECHIDDDVLYFFFSETGGQNESDTQGWSRDYCFSVDSDFMIVEAEYSQG